MKLLITFPLTLGLWITSTHAEHWLSIRTAPCHGLPVWEQVSKAEQDRLCGENVQACVIRAFEPSLGSVEHKCRIVSEFDLATAKGLATGDFGVSVYEHELKHWEGWDHL